MGFFHCARMWAGLCILSITALSCAAVAAAEGLHELAHKPHGQMERTPQVLAAADDGVRRLASVVNYEDYSPVPNTDVSTPPPLRRRLLQDYSPMANTRNPPSSNRKLLQDNSPMANRRSRAMSRKLLQDYSPVANQRSPIVHRKLLQVYYPTAYQRFTSQRRKILQDYSPMANQRSSPSSP